ncbi:hypothetical protein BSZ39_02945 [Bowdeniella nasicola]|uniref:ATPase n=1 Tax=Bowdeniella nasicola TaxID=208480 RepID=A0A1Q5Q4A4_9ACTO|nr:hypothetical protein [Bowdeniella nasicola]OKL54658.1 hypothetical protein BSZ39_02945 [Bowdeniella nasicola]
MNEEATSEHRGSSLTEILDTLADMVRNARAMPMSASVLVSRAEMLEMIDTARELIPTEIARADATLRGADVTIASAREQAERIRAQARREAEQLLGNEEVVTTATRHAKHVEVEAEARAAKLTRDAQDYCDRTLAQLEVNLNRALREVAGGRKVLGEAIAAYDETAAGKKDSSDDA